MIHDALGVANQARVPPPEFEIDIDCGEGAGPPIVYVKVTWLAESAIEGAAGGGEVTVRVTDTI